MMDFEQAKDILFQWDGQQSRILEAWETPDEFVFQTCDTDEDPFLTWDWSVVNKESGIPLFLGITLKPGELPAQIQTAAARRIL